MLILAWKGLALFSLIYNIQSTVYFLFPWCTCTLSPYLAVPHVLTDVCISPHILVSLTLHTLTLSHPHTLTTLTSPTLHDPPTAQGNAKDIQQLFSSIDHRIEALKLSASHSDTEPTKEKEPQVRGSRESSAFDEEDKESCFEEAPSSPDSSFGSHAANIRQKAVSYQYRLLSCRN